MGMFRACSPLDMPALTSLDTTGITISHRKFLEFLENTVVLERNVLEKWGTHRG